MGMVMPDLSVRCPGMIDEEWRSFLDRYKKEVCDPIREHVQCQAKVGVVGLTLVPVLLVVLWYFGLR